MDSEADVDPVDEELALGPRRLPRGLVRAGRVLCATIAIAIFGAGLTIAARPQVAAGHGSVAAATAARYHADNAARGNRIRGFFLI